jgi:hypothetical protein
MVARVGASAPVSPAAPTEDGPSHTISEFCRLEALSTPSYHKLQKAGLGPETYTPPGTRIIRITAKARSAWQQRMAALSASNAAKLEAQRRQEQASRAGKLAARSALHVSGRSSRPKPKIA